MKPYLRGGGVSWIMNARFVPADAPFKRRSSLPSEELGPAMGLRRGSAPSRCPKRTCSLSRPEFERAKENANR